MVFSEFALKDKPDLIAWKRLNSHASVFALVPAYKNSVQSPAGLKHRFGTVGDVRIIIKEMIRGKNNPEGQRNVHVMFKYSMHSTCSILYCRHAASWLDQECSSITSFVLLRFQPGSGRLHICLVFTALTNHAPLTVQYHKDAVVDTGYDSLIKWKPLATNTMFS